MPGFFWVRIEGFLGYPKVNIEVFVLIMLETSYGLGFMDCGLT